MACLEVAVSVRLSKSVEMRPVVAFGLAVLLVLQGCARVKAVPERSFTNSVGMVMIRLSSGYYVCKYEVRQSEFAAVMGYNPSEGKGPNHPVENLTGDEALLFCKKLTEHERANGRLPQGFHYALPSYEEWREFAADASLKGSVTPAGGRGGSELDYALEVGSGEVNRLGIYDVRGNVSEYLRDVYNTGSLTIVGADWCEYREDFLPVRNRGGFMEPDKRSKNVGFRCVLIPD